MQGTLKNNADNICTPKCSNQDINNCMIGYNNDINDDEYKDKDLEDIMHGIEISAQFFYNVMVIVLKGFELTLWFLFKVSGFVLSLIFDFIQLLAQLVNTTHEKAIYYETDKSTTINITVKHIHN
jgi:hypothetical protein